jgi:hypothetical protein
MRRTLERCLAGATLAGLITSAARAEPGHGHPPAAVTLAVIGDTPYGADQLTVLRSTASTSSPR